RHNGSDRNAKQQSPPIHGNCGFQGHGSFGNHSGDQLRRPVAENAANKCGRGREYRTLDEKLTNNLFQTGAEREADSKFRLPLCTVRQLQICRVDTSDEQEHSNRSKQQQQEASEATYTEVSQRFSRNVRALEVTARENLGKSIR